MTEGRMLEQRAEMVAARIAADFCGQSPSSLRRFPTGMDHWVYDVIGPADERFVVRLGSPDQGQDFAGAVHWSNVLRPKGVPLPRLLGSGEWEQCPYVVLERIAGDDLGAVYDGLDLEEKQAIAASVVGVQQRVASLGEGQGFGYVRLPDSAVQPSWWHFLEASISRSRSRMERAGRARAGPLERLERALAPFESYFSRVRPLPFLDDATTKNVLVHRGQLTGIVDVDWICFGDPLLTVALTRASLLGSGRDLAYTDHWATLLNVTPEQEGALRLYTALFFVDFMSELGHRFNRDTPTITAAEVERLEGLLEAELRDP